MYQFIRRYRYILTLILYSILMGLSYLSFTNSHQLDRLFLFDTLILTGTFIVFFLIITYLMHYFEKISYQDSLTNLPNLASFENQVNYYLKTDPDKQKKMAVLFLDINRFKELKDQYGQVISDNIIKATGYKLASSLRSSDFISRIGGDEFVIGLPDLKSAEEVQKVTRRIIDNFDQTVRIDDQDYPISICVGVSIYPEEGDNLKKLIKHADEAASLISK
ncbi:GGDEF domain-containing protein [Eubacteriaceae bacterium ES2]|nr:GGDEF domain-containing protein [Eubacteriaceae bacterium ES2]